MDVDTLLLKLVELKMLYGNLPVIMPQENNTDVKSVKWLADITHIEVGNHDWDNWGNTNQKIVIF